MVLENPYSIWWTKPHDPIRIATEARLPGGVCNGVSLDCACGWGCAGSSWTLVGQMYDEHLKLFAEGV